MDRQTDYDLKLSRLWDRLNARKLDGVYITRRANFSWLTGGDNRIFLNHPTGSSSLLITRKGKYLLAAVMDGARMLEEEVSGLGIALFSHTWFENRLEILEMLSRGLHIGGDTPTPGCEYLDETFWAGVHFPLTEFDIAIARKVGAESDAAFQQICRTIQPGDSERKIAGMLMGEFFSRGFYASVMLVGSDERLYKYRHCLPTEKPVEKLVLMHVAGHKHGFHANVTRLVHFGPIPEELHHRFKVVSTLNATLLSCLEPGLPFTVLGEKMKTAYAQLGWADEWKGHVQGFPCGYETCYDTWATQPEARVGYNQTYDWLQTIPGVKTEELSLFTLEKGVEIISVGSGWPILQVNAGGRTWNEPDILIR